MPGFKPLKPSAAASTKPGRQPLLLQGCCSFLAVSVPALQPALCLHSLLLLGHSSLPFARLQTPKTLRGSFHQAWPSAFAAPGLLLLYLAVSVPALQPALCLHSLLLLGHSSLPFARLQMPKTLRGSFHQAWPSAFAAPGLLLFPGRQRSSIAACPLTLTDLDKSNCKDRTCWWDNLPTHGTGTGKEYRSSDRGALERGSAAPGR